MYSGIFIFVFLSQLSFGFLTTMSSEKKEYITYLNNVVKYICSQKGWNHLELKLCLIDGIPVDEVLESASSSNLLDVSTLMIILLNNVYVEVIRSFLEFLSLTISECEKYSDDNLFKELIDCTELLENGVKKSTILFDKLYKATTFISYLDIKYAFSKIQGNPFVVVDEIYFVKQFVSSIILTDWSCYKTQNGYFDKNTAVTIISNIKNFTNKVYDMLFNIKEGKKILINISYRINIKQMIDMEYKTCKNKYSSYNDFILHEVDTVYDHIARNEFDKFGFNELLSPVINDFPTLAPPKDDPFVSGLRIAAVKNLMEVINWDSLNGISIQEPYQTISLNRVLRDPVDYYNIILKKKYILSFIKCWFFKILTKYFSYLSAFIQLFNEEKNDLETIIKKNMYIKSVLQLYNTLKSNLEFFNNINLALMILKKSSIWYQNHTALFLSPIQKFIDDFISSMNDKNLLRDNFFNNEDCDKLIIAKSYLTDIINIKNHLYIKLHDMKRKTKKRCIFDTNSILNIKYIKNNMKENAIEYNITTVNNPITSSQQCCEELYIFCENFNNVELKNLCFDKIY
ncbi:uncharacterized protein LOC126907276 [Daktulosphaira vitifoliae]|uniref:uncharacterized protein LOC126907276 n=1 Tax=Daktulosphaira vitifoliae TaxID=58002 RepID=UPI0021AAEAE9|nr:uncharacterized protein LOC126907276 [Daktulosphaira vitifoliae]